MRNPLPRVRILLTAWALLVSPVVAAPAAGQDEAPDFDRARANMIRMVQIEAILAS